jgi:hypothetical protein
LSKVAANLHRLCESCRHSVTIIRTVNTSFKRLFTFIP